MSQYNLSKPKKKRSRIPFLIVLSIFALATGAIAAYLTQNKSPTSTLSSIAKLVAEPTSSLNAVRARASSCTSEARDQFVKEANRINAVFEDNFMLAEGKSRIALAPIVADMQGATRDLKALPVDSCGKITQGKLATAYGEAVGMFLDFMKEAPVGVESDSIDEKLQNAYQYLHAYQLDVAAPFILNDLFAWLKNKEDELPQPPEFAYLDATPNDGSRCDDHALLTRVVNDSYKASINHYDSSKSVRDLTTATPTPALCNGATWLDTPTPPPTPTPTVTQTPTPTPSPTPTAVSRRMQFRIDGDNVGGIYSVEYQIGEEEMVAIDDAKSSWRHAFLSTRGAQLLFRIADRDRGEPVSCTIIADGEILAQKERGKSDFSVTCTATVPYP